MVAVHIACVGRLRKGFAAEGAAEYARRLSRYCDLTVKEVKTSRPEEECRLLEGALAKSRWTVALSPEGRTLTTKELASWLQRRFDGGRSPLGMAIGGPDGLTGRFRQECDEVLSFSALTFPHELFRVMLFEQLYRAFTLLRGEPYHRG